MHRNEACRWAECKFTYQSNHKCKYKEEQETSVLWNVNNTKVHSLFQTNNKNVYFHLLYEQELKKESICLHSGWFPQWLYISPESAWRAIGPFNIQYIPCLWPPEETPQNLCMWFHSEHNECVVYPRHDSCRRLNSSGLKPASFHPSTWHHMYMYAHIINICWSEKCSLALIPARCMWGYKLSLVKCQVQDWFSSDSWYMLQ